MTNQFCAGIHVAVTDETGKYLILKRSTGDFEDAGCWDLPGGGIDANEQPLDAALREAHEEAHIEITVEKIITAWALPYRNKWSIELLATGKYLSGKIVLSREHSEYRWADNNELRSIEPKGVHIKKLIDCL